MAWPQTIQTMGNCLRLIMLSYGILLLLNHPVLAQAIEAKVMNGIDVLAVRNFDAIKGKRVGLITNQTGRSANGASSIDIINKAPGVRLVALFSPEHGIRGVDDEKYPSGVDRTTGLPIYSLYGATCRPTSEMLSGIDALVFDIQDIGTRFYTYIGTLSLAMQAARQAGIEFIVLDRPNPIGGIDVGGAIPKTLLDPKINGCGSLTSIHPIPTRHGMTVGELAKMFNVEFGIGCDLRIIEMQGWNRKMYFDETGQKWVNPSPNMTSLDAAILYPGLGILETTNLSVGRGTDQPFQIYGAPWIDATAVIANLANRSIRGIKFTPCTFVPAAPHPYAGKICSGVRVTVSNRDALDPILAGLQLLQAIAETHPGAFRVYDGFSTEIGDTNTWSLLSKKEIDPKDAVTLWDVNLERFNNVRDKYLLYL